MAVRGRTEECRRLREFAAGLREGLGGVLVLSGDPGVGKTTLLEYATAEARPLEVLQVAGVAAEADFPFAALHRLLIPVLAPSRLDALPPAERHALRVACGLAEGPPVDPDLAGRATHTLLIGLTTAGPLLCCIDDAHWLDPESLAALAHVARQNAALGLLFTITTPSPAASLGRGPGPDPSPSPGPVFGPSPSPGPGFGVSPSSGPGFGPSPSPDSGEATALAGLPILRIAGLSEADGVELLRSIVTCPLDQRVAARLVAATGGNPLALHTLGRELTAGQLTGARSLPDPLPVGSRLAEHHLRHIRRLPEPIQLWLLLAAAEPRSDLAVINAAATRLGVTPAGVAAAGAASAEAARAGVATAEVVPGGVAHLLTGVPQVAFREQPVRSAIYSGATGVQRRTVHAALAEVTTRPVDADLRAWHLAAACVGPDEQIAAELVRTADRAAARGGYSARVAHLTRAAELTRAGPTRSECLLAAAETALTAGAPLQALATADAALSAPAAGADLPPAGAGQGDDLPPGHDVTHGRALIVRANALVMLGGAEAYAKGSALCLAAARAFADSEPRLARDALLQAVEHLIRAGHLVRDTSPAEIAAVGQRTATQPGAAPSAELLLEAFATLASAGTEAALPRIRQAVEALLDPAARDDEVLRRHMTGAVLSALLWDADVHRALWRRVIGIARESGALWQLVIALYCAATLEVQLGETAAGRALLAESDEIRAAIGATDELWAVQRHPELLAWRSAPGDTGPVAELDTALAAAGSLGSGSIQSLIRIGLVVLALGRGDYPRARDVAREVFETDTLGLHSRVLPDLVEAAIRSGDRLLAERALVALTAQATAAGTDWALGLLARSRALLTPAAGAEALYRQAITLLSGTPARADLARAHLLYGEWLRRQRRRRDARAELRTALAGFERFGALGFAVRAGQELDATGQPAARRAPDSRTAGVPGTLTPQEAAIARLAASGATNGEIAEQLFLSANTVDHHLRKVYRKLDVTSRRQLRDSVGGQ
jgi:DNA-binding CsgD family transcriptional regulator